MQARDSSLGIILPEVGEIGQQLAGFIVFHAQTFSKESLYLYIFQAHCTLSHTVTLALLNV